MLDAKVTALLEKEKRWPEEMALLRAVLLDCGLTETFKWRNPCYTYKDKNIALLGSYKDFCCISFIKGALLKDEAKILVQQGANTQSARIVPFTGPEEVLRLKPLLKEYIFEALEVEKSGLKVEYRQADAMEFPDELNLAFERNPKFKSAFAQLTPGRQKGYLLYFSNAKQAKTRGERINKYTERILNGKGLHDCVCGHSKKMPSCDGSHKYL